MDARISEAYGLEVMDDCFSADMCWHCELHQGGWHGRRHSCRYEASNGKGHRMPAKQPVPPRTCATGCHWYLTELYWHLNLSFIMLYQRFAARFGIQTNTCWHPSAHIIFTWATSKTPLFIFSKRVAVRASGVSQNVVGVSPRKLFWSISVRKLLA